MPNGSNVRVNITDWGSQDRLQVRLCNTATLNCTQYKTIENTPDGNTVTFTNMQMGTYAGDVIIGYGVFKGYFTIERNS